MKATIQAYSRTIIPLLGAASLAVAQTGIAAEEMSHEHHQHQHQEHQQHATHAGHGPHGTHIHHQHGKGGFMFEYRFMSMNMDGLLSGSDSVSTQDISGMDMLMDMGGNVTGQRVTPGKQYMMAPTEMTMDMHMLMGMYGFTDRLTGMIMLNYLKNEMDMVMHMRMVMEATGMVMSARDVESSMETSGIGDTRIGAMYSVNKKWTGALNISLPTGSIDEKVMMMSNPDTQAAYPMQLGSGTFDLIPSFTYKDEKGSAGWGAQFEYIFRIGENDNEYSLGDKAELTAWYVQSVGGNVHLSGRLDYLNWQEIEGQDPKINAMMASTGDPSNSGGQRLDLLVGITGVFGGHRIGLEVGKPIFQDLDGIQMETDLVMSFGYQFMM